MGAGKILLADKDREYAGALARAVSNLHNGFDVTIMSLEPCGKVKGCGGIAFQDYDLILIGGYPEETVVSIGSRIPGRSRVVMLTEHMADSLVKQSGNGENHCWYIYKYVNVSDIISDLSYLIGIITGRKNLLRKSFAPILIGFYSAGGGAGKSAVAVGTSRELSRYHDKKVLYLSFEEISALDLFFNNHPEGRNIGDYLYYLLEKQNECLCSRPEGFTASDDYGVEAFYPSKGRNDLNYLTQEEMICFIKIISDSCRYDYIALELKSDLAGDTLFLMNLCARIVLIQSDDPVSEFKNRKFIAYMETLNTFKYKDRFLLVVNRTGCPGQERKEDVDSCGKNIKRIPIEKDENSFRFTENRLDIDINHVFGVGIKKIADEIISKTGMPGPEQ